MKRIAKKLALVVFFLAVCGTGTLHAETVIMDDFGLDYHIKSFVMVYAGYSIYSLEIIDSNNGDVSYGLLAINPSLTSNLHFMIVAFEDEKYWSFVIQGYWAGNGTVASLSTNNVSTIDQVKLSVGEQRR